MPYLQYFSKNHQAKIYSNFLNIEIQKDDKNFLIQISLEFSHH